MEVKCKMMSASRKRVVFLEKQPGFYVEGICTVASLEGFALYVRTSLDARRGALAS